MVNILTMSNKRTDKVVHELSELMTAQQISNGVDEKEALKKTLQYFINLLSRCTYEDPDLYDMLEKRLRALKGERRHVA